MASYARAKCIPRSNEESFTAGKLYPVVSESEIGLGFWTVNNRGNKCFCLWEGCSFLGGDDWERVEVDDE